MRWQTNNFKEKPERNWKKWLLITVLAISVFGVLVSAGYRYVTTPPPPPPPPPGLVGICNMSVSTCFSNEINYTSFHYNLRWSSNGNITAAPPTVYLQSAFVNTTLGVVQMQLQVSGADYVNVTVITITDLNNTSYRQAYSCNHAACGLTRAILYFHSSIPFNGSDLYQFAFGSSGNLAVYRVKFS